MGHLHSKEVDPGAHFARSHHVRRTAVPKITVRSGAMDRREHLLYQAKSDEKAASLTAEIPSAAGAIE